MALSSEKFKALAFQPVTRSTLMSLVSFGRGVIGEEYVISLPIKVMMVER
jgi:hypothetical protein